MSETPKKIWLSPCMEWEDVVQQSQSDIPYIRADIVDELVETLKKLRVWTSPAIHNEYVKPMIEVALAKLKESHD